MDSITPECTAVLDHFDVITKPELVKGISVMHKITCSSDPFPTKLLMDHQEAITCIDTILHIANLSLATEVFLTSCKSSIVTLIKKNGLDCEVLKNYRPVSNLSFLSKFIEKIISVRILQHITDNGIIDVFQSAYKAGHCCETALTHEGPSIEILHTKIIFYKIPSILSIHTNFKKYLFCQTN